MTWDTPVSDLTVWHVTMVALFWALVWSIVGPLSPFRYRRASRHYGGSPCDPCPKCLNQAYERGKQDAYRHARTIVRDYKAEKAAKN